jgi:hypothetical protein
VCGIQNKQLWAIEPLEKSDTQMDAATDHSLPNPDLNLQNVHGGRGMQCYSTVSSLLDLKIGHEQTAL